MTGPTHNDLYEAVGTLKGVTQAMADRFDRLEDTIAKGFADQKSEMAEVRKDIADLKAKESERKGAFQLGHWVIGIISAVAVFIADHLWK